MAHLTSLTWADSWDGVPEKAGVLSSMHIQCHGHAPFYQSSWGTPALRGGHCWEQLKALCCLGRQLVQDNGWTHRILNKGTVTGWEGGCRAGGRSRRLETALQHGEDFILSHSRHTRVMLYPVGCHSDPECARMLMYKLPPQILLPLVVSEKSELSYIKMSIESSSCNRNTQNQENVSKKHMDNDTTLMKQLFTGLT